MDTEHKINWSYFIPGVFVVVVSLARVAGQDWGTALGSGLVGTFFFGVLPWFLIGVLGLGK